MKVSDRRRRLPSLCRCRLVTPGESLPQGLSSPCGAGVRMVPGQADGCTGNAERLQEYSESQNHIRTEV